MICALCKCPYAPTGKHLQRREELVTHICSVWLIQWPGAHDHVVCVSQIVCAEVTHGQNILSREFHFTNSYYWNHIWVEHWLVGCAGSFEWIFVISRMWLSLIVHHMGVDFNHHRRVFIMCENASFAVFLHVYKKAHAQECYTVWSPEWHWEEVTVML